MLPGYCLGTAWVRPAWVWLGTACLGAWYLEAWYLEPGSMAWYLEPGSMASVYVSSGAVEGEGCQGGGCTQERYTREVPDMTHP